MPSALSWDHSIHLGDNKRFLMGTVQLAVRQAASLAAASIEPLVDLRSNI